MGHIGRQDDERELAGLRALCSSTGASTNVDQLTEQVVTMATSVLYTYEVEIERAAEGGGSTTTLSSQDELAEWIAIRALDAVTSNLCATDTFSCLYSLTHSADLVQLVPCTPDTCAVVHPNTLTLQHNADCAEFDLEHAALVAVQSFMTNPSVLQDLQQQFPTVAGMRLLWDEGNASKVSNSLTDDTTASLHRQITPAGIAMLVVTGVTLVAAIAVLVVWRGDWWHQQRQPKLHQSSRKSKVKQKNRHATKSRGSEREAAQRHPPARTQQSYLVQTKVCTTMLDTSERDPENCYLTEQIEAEFPRAGDHPPVLGALPWQKLAAQRGVAAAAA